MAWIRDHKTINRSLGLQFIQLYKNLTWHKAIKTELYRVLFGTKPTVKLRTVCINSILKNKIEE